jgi:hypothetical protein
MIVTNSEGLTQAEVDLILGEPDRELARLREENASLRKNIERLTANPADHRYWEGRWRDEAAENERLYEVKERMRIALGRCRSQFRWYEELHKAKGPDHADKAARNREFAEMCEVALCGGPQVNPHDGEQ